MARPASRPKAVEYALPLPQGVEGADHTWAPSVDPQGAIVLVPTPVLDAAQRLAVGGCLPTSMQGHQDRFLIELNNEVGLFLANRIALPNLPAALRRDDAEAIAKASGDLRRALLKAGPIVRHGIDIHASFFRVRGVTRNDEALQQLRARSLLDRLWEMLAELESAADHVAGASSEAADSSARVDRYEAGEFAWCVARAFYIATKKPPPKSRWFADAVREAAKALAPDLRVGEESVFAAVAELKEWATTYGLNRPAPMRRTGKPG